MTLRVVSKILDSNVFVCGEGGECFIVDAGAEVEDVVRALGLFVGGIDAKGAACDGENVKEATSCAKKSIKENPNCVEGDVKKELACVAESAGKDAHLGAKNGQSIEKGTHCEGLKNSAQSLPKVQGILLTHGHYDHCFHVLDYAKNFGCKIYASEQAEEYLKNPAHNYSDGKFSVQDFSDFVFLRGDGVLTLGNLQVEYFSLGGHSKSDICYRFHDEIFVGDVLLGRDMGRIDLFGGSKQEMQKSLQKLVDTNYRIMHAGHGEDYEKSTQDKIAKLWLKFLSRQH